MAKHELPLEIGEIKIGRGWLGLTSCPGRGRRKSYGQNRDRKLGADLRQIKHWGAAAILSILEPVELGWLQVPHLGQEVERIGMTWLLLPIRDGGVPEDAAERLWSQYGPRLRRHVERGERVLIHCRAGHGRTGMMAARLLIEHAWDADRAIAEVRRARPGALKRLNQEAIVRACGAAGRQIANAGRS